MHWRIAPTVAQTHTLKADARSQCKTPVSAPKARQNRHGCARCGAIAFPLESADAATAKGGVKA
jgi:hypothetical protein